MTEETKTTRATKPKTPAIYGALAKVFEGIKNVPKNGKMSHGGGTYSYLMADDVQAALNPLLADNGVIVRSNYTAREITRKVAIETNGNDRIAPYVNVDLELVYVAVEDGSEFPVYSTGESRATDDKSINKALTQAIKNAHRTTFQFASGEVDSDSADPGAQAPKTTKAQAEVAKAKAAAPTRTSEDPKITAIKNRIREEFVPKVGNDEVNSKWAEVTKSVGKPKGSIEVLTALVDALTPADSGASA